MNTRFKFHVGHINEADELVALRVKIIQKVGDGDKGKVIAIGVNDFGLFFGRIQITALDFCEPENYGLNINWGCALEIERLLRRGEKWKQKKQAKKEILHLKVNF